MGWTRSGGGGPRQTLATCGQCRGRRGALDGTRAPGRAWGRAGASAHGSDDGGTTTDGTHARRVPCLKRPARLMARPERARYWGVLQDARGAEPALQRTDRTGEAPPTRRTWGAPRAWPGFAQGN